MMKRIVFFAMVLSGLFAGLSLSGCTTVKSYDRSTPVSESSAISPGYDLTITHIDDKPFSFSTGVAVSWLLIPAGVHTIKANFYVNTGKSDFTAKGIETAPHDFKPGHYYYISSQTNFAARTVSMRIIDATSSETDKDVLAAKKKVESMR
jgi:hypothetical protein